MIHTKYTSGIRADKAETKHDRFLAEADIVVIGGGVVGCAVARRMALEGASVILLEKAADILDGASKGNSAILHTGFDAPVGTLEWECVQSGYQEYLEIHKSMNLPLLKSGAIVAAWTQEEEARFPEILKKAYENEVKDLHLLTRDQTLALEPNLSGDVLAAITVPQESVIDPWSAPLAYLMQALENGGQAIFNAEVTGGEYIGSRWVLETARGTVRAKYVVNCAGLYGDILDHNVHGHSDFTIKPRKGQFVVFDKAADKLIRSIVLPVPTQRTKGIVLFPTIFGNLMVGPTAEEQDSRSNASVDKDTLNDLHAQAIKKLPLLANIPITATYAGIRSATERPEYRIIHDADRNWLTLGGIRSTGLTAALGIAQYVRTILADPRMFSPLANPSIPRVPNLAEQCSRDYQTPGYGEIVCHCEMVTQREIKAVLDNRVMPAGSLAGLKRRTRVTMGRCQGFYCSARLAELTEGKFDEPIAIGETDE